MTGPAKEPQQHKGIKAQKVKSVRERACNPRTELIGLAQRDAEQTKNKWDKKSDYLDMC